MPGRAQRRRQFGRRAGFTADLHACQPTDGDDVYRTYFLQHGAMVQFIGSIWSMWSLTPYGGQSDDEELPEERLRNSI